MHHSLLKIGAFLTVRQALHKKARVRISEMWFEYFTGRTQGPCWFRYTQAWVKMIVFAAAVVLSLSFTAGSEFRSSYTPGQTILVQKPRTLKNLGFGQKSGLYSVNFSQELLFSRQFGACADQNEFRMIYYNFRALSPLKETYSEDRRIPVECLSSRNGYFARCHYESSFIPTGVGP